MIDEVAGFSAIEKLTIGDKNEEAICEKSQKLLEQFNTTPEEEMIQV